MCVHGAPWVVVFERNKPEQMYKEMCLRRLFIPFLRTGFVLAARIP